MRLLEKNKAWPFILECAQVAKSSPCFRAQCGSIIVKNGEVIGRGYNGPPGNEVLEECRKDLLPENFKGEKACCVHAEQRAIMDALQRNPSGIEEAMLYFSRVKDGEPVPSGEPWCTICSKMALDSGIAEFVLWHESGITAYEVKEYNDLSFKYRRS